MDLHQKTQFARLTVIAALAGATLDTLLPEPLERVRVCEQRRRAKVRAALRRPRCRSPTWRCSCA
jgi:hypothetical protein